MAKHRSYPNNLQVKINVGDYTIIIAANIECNALPNNHKKFLTYTLGSILNLWCKGFRIVMTFLIFASFRSLGKIISRKGAKAAKKSENFLSDTFT